MILHFEKKQHNLICKMWKHKCVKKNITTVHLDFFFCSLSQSKILDLILMPCMQIFLFFFFSAAGELHISA